MLPLRNWLVLLLQCGCKTTQIWLRKLYGILPPVHEMNECGLEWHKLYIPININEMKWMNEWTNVAEGQQYILS